MNFQCCRLWIILCFCTIACYCCGYLPKSLCQLESKCRCTRHNETIVCCNITTNFMLKKGLECTKSPRNTTKSIYIHNATLSTLNVDLGGWPGLETLSVTDGHIHKLQGHFVGSLTCANFSGNNISEISSTAFNKLHRLNLLDLSRNNLTKIPNITNIKHNFTLDISNNSYVWCQSIKELIIKHQNTTYLQFINVNDTYCLSARSFHWFNSTDSMSLSQLEIFLKGPEEECPKNCSCKPYRADFTNQLELKLSVDCSNQELTELPPLPPNTIFLDVSNNYISSLKPLSKNESYSDVREFIADNNVIESIAVLEGSKFIENFAIMSLRNNKIRNIPTYILTNAFDRNFHNKIVKFGGNTLVCDCSTVQIKLWLISNKNYIEDHNDLLCDKGFERVIEIDPKRVCIHEKDWMDYIYYIIAGEIFLLVTLVSKVTYDYWIFKSFGYLPWPASRMPKLPCDWCFET